MRVVNKSKKSDQPKKTKADPVIVEIRKLGAQLVKLLSKETPAPVVTVEAPPAAPAPLVTVKVPKMEFPGPPKKWKFTGEKTGNTWEIIAERIE